MSTTHRPKAPLPQPLRGVLYMFGAVAAFSAMDVLMKRLGESYPASQVTVLRAVTALPFLLGAARWMGQLTQLAPRRWRLHLVRGLLSSVTLYSFVFALRGLSLANTYAIFMSAPLLIVALSGPLLHERLSVRQGLAVLLGMLGVLVALRPTATGISLVGGLAALTAAIGYALSALLIRVQMRTETSWATVFWGLLFQALLCAPFAWSGWVALRPSDWPLVVLLGLTGALGQHWITSAFQLARAQLLAPLEYCALLWGIAFDALLWRQWPEPHVCVGAAIVVLSGVYVLSNAREAPQH